MLDGVPGWLGVASGFLALTALAATAFAVFGSSWSKSRNALKDEIIKDSKERIIQLETTETRLVVERDIEVNKRKVLEGVITGKDELYLIKDELGGVKTELKNVNTKLGTLIKLQSSKGA